MLLQAVSIQVRQQFALRGYNFWIVHDSTCPQWETYVALMLFLTWVENHSSLQNAVQLIALSCNPPNSTIWFFLHFLSIMQNPSYSNGQSRIAQLCKNRINLIKMWYIHSRINIQIIRLIMTEAWPVTQFFVQIFRLEKLAQRTVQHASCIVNQYTWLIRNSCWHKLMSNLYPGPD